MPLPLVQGLATALQQEAPQLTAALLQEAPQLVSPLPQLHLQVATSACLYLLG